LMDDPDADRQMMSTVIQTAQRMEATGNGLPETDAQSMANAKVHGTKLQEYIDRLQNHTRLALIVKGIVGFFSPVSPTINPTEQLSPEFQKLLRTMPLDDALTTFLAAHPDGLPYTVMKTQVPSGAPLPSSPEVLQVLQDKPEFFSKYPTAGAWFLPQTSATDSFSQDAYHQQMAMNLRVNKSVTDWYRDYYFAAAAPVYFATKEGFDRRYADAKGNTQLRQALQDQYETWKKTYFTQHPVFAEEIQSPEGKQRRARVMEEMTRALSDPDAPDIPHKEAMGTLLKTYQGFRQRMDQAQGQTKSAQQLRQAIKDQYDAWAYTYVFDHPQIKAFYNRVIAPAEDE
jgi:hypothetical protein